MRIEFNKTGAQRKELVKAISEITGAEAVYKFMPTCAYEIDYFTVTKDGTLEFDDRADSEEIENILEQWKAEPKMYPKKPKKRPVHRQRGFVPSLLPLR